MKDEFIHAIQTHRKVRVTFFSKEDARFLTRKCAPMDYGPSRRAKEKSDRYHLWDYESDMKVHTLSLNPEQIDNIETLDEYFDPAEFITWDTSKSPWFIPRNWGVYS
jgi:hypothetical protein